ncbi:MAG: hypothetical protein KF752_02395 [Pirellulaceae bacterium]|nr:hypothetical protein [Pirellulaceae bacterium]
MSETLLRKPLTGLLLLASAAGGPYLWYETEVGKHSRQAWQSVAGTMGVSDAQDRDYSAVGYGTGPAGSTGSLGLPGAGGLQSAANRLTVDPFQPNPHVMEQLPIATLAEVLRFDVTPDWVMGRFPRVSTVLSEAQLDGLRVPLITGTTPSDLAGTLTYYFDRYKQLKRLTVHAAVGDPTRFVAELQQAYQMSQEPSLGGNLYVIKWNGAPTSLLHIAPATVVYADAHYARFNLFLELNQAGLEYGLSPEARQLVEVGRQTNRW